MGSRAKEILKKLEERIFRGSERLMGMDNRIWARHASPLSVYSRVVTGPLIFFALWSPFWIGWKGVGFIIIAGIWTWLNPRAFPAPKSTDSWATKGVLGERAFLNRKTVPIPDGHLIAARIATGCSILFAIIALYGFITRNFWAAFAGWHGAIIAKIWFVDRCVWLWEEMRAMHPVYTAWDNADWETELLETGHDDKATANI
ncbi:MAG: DUF6653 family protein [Pseudomonadota bacterium]